MNIQAMMKQAQKLQKDMMNEKENIDKTVFIGKASFITIEVYGNKKVKSIKIDHDNLSDLDVEMLEDLILTAINDAMNQIDKETEQKMGRFTNGLPGMF